MSIKVLNLTFDVIEVECIEHGSSEVGRIEHLTQKIYIQKGLSKEQKKVVLLHEILHSIFQQLGFDEEHNDEKLICSLSTTLIKLLEDNPKITSYE